MKYADISGLADRELNAKVKALRGEIFEARMKNALGQLANPMTIREMRRDIARMKTAQTAKAELSPKAASASKSVAKAAPKTARRATAAGKVKKTATKAGAKG